MDDETTNALRNKIKYLKNVLRDVPGCVYWKDKNGIYLGCNQVFLEMVGMTCESELIGKKDADLSWKAQADMLRRHDEWVTREEKTKTVEETVTLDNGEERLYSVVKSPLRDEHNNVIGVVGTSIDITYREILEKKLRESQTREESFKVLSAIGGMMAHELRTPLASLKLIADSVESLLPDLLNGYKIACDLNKIDNPIRPDILSSVAQYTEDIDHAVEYMQTTISTILTGMNYSTSGKSVQTQTFSLSKLVKKAIEQYPLQPQQKALIVIDVSEEIKILADEGTLTHILHNLLKNALHAIESCQKGTITITANQKNSFAQLDFVDTGQGIKPETLPHIFEPFYTTKGKSAQSVGLGLYFCQLALKSIDAHIECDSKWGEYTHFKITLPIAHQQHQPNQERKL